MAMFAEPGDPTPLTEIVALERAEKCVEPIARFFMYGAMAFFLPVFIFEEVPLPAGVAVALALWYVAWVFVFRRWKAWAIAGGCDPQELELLGEEVGILPVRGSFLWYLQWPAHAP
jgi:hypothetical protein